MTQCIKKLAEHIPIQLYKLLDAVYCYEFGYRHADQKHVY